MSLISEVAEYLEDQGVGTVGTDIFVGYLPESVVPSLAVIDTGGLQPDRYLPTKEPTFQIYIRSATYSSGKAKLDAVRDALHKQVNTTLVSAGEYIYFIFAISEGGHLGRNPAGQDEFSMNFQARLRND